MKITQNNYLLAPDKIEIKTEILSEYQREITDLYNTPVGNVKKLAPNVNKMIKKSMWFIIKNWNFTWG